MGSIVWDREIAEIYDETYAAQFDLSVLETMLDLLSALAQGVRRSSSPSAPAGSPWRSASETSRCKGSKSPHRWWNNCKPIRAPMR
jgi:hypothetical protein